MQDKIMVGLIGDDGKCKDAHRVLKEVLAEVFPGHEFSDYDKVKDGVRLGYVDGGGMFHARFIGVKLVVNDQYYRGDTYNNACRLFSRNLGTYTLELNGLTEGQVRLVMETVEGIFE